MKMYLTYYKREKTLKEQILITMFSIIPSVTMQTFLFQTIAVNIEKPYKCDICDMIITQAILLYYNFVKSWYIFFFTRAYPDPLNDAHGVCLMLWQYALSQMPCVWRFNGKGSLGFRLGGSHIAFWKTPANIFI